MGGGGGYPPELAWWTGGLTKGLDCRRVGGSVETGCPKKNKSREGVRGRVGLARQGLGGKGPRASVPGGRWFKVWCRSHCRSDCEGRTKRPPQGRHEPRSHKVQQLPTLTLPIPASLHMHATATK